MLADEVRALAVLPSPVAPNRRPRPAVRDRALKPWRLIPDAEKEVRVAHQRAGTCFKCGDAGHAIRICPRQALAAIEIEAPMIDEIDDAAAQAAMYAAH